MKSKRAEEYIQYHRHKGPYTEGDFDAWRVYEAVELAEMDMVDKAAKAFCAVHCPKGCPFYGAECLVLIVFRQKIMEG